MNGDKIFRILEGVAVVCSVLYTWLLAEGNMWCWWFAICASVLYMVLTLQVGLYAEWFLHLFYLGMAVYGFSRSGLWQESGTAASLHWRIHLMAIVLAGIGTYLTGRGLATLKGAKATFLDAFTTLFSLWATWLMVNFYPENWLYWIVIDSASAILYFRRHLYFTSILYVAYTALAIRGWMLWTSG